MPKFEEKEVNKYFLHFEKIAESLKWLNESWTLLLQSVFVGKAREMYSSLSVEQYQKYDVVKKAVLKAYELVPEAYRQKFRSAKKESNQTHVEFARVQEQMFDRWLSSKNVNEDFKQLRQLVLIEQFKECIHANIKTHLDERDINNLEDAATRGVGHVCLNSIFGKFSRRFTRDFTTTDKTIQKCLISYVKKYFNRKSVEVQR